MRKNRGLGKFLDWISPWAWWTCTILGAGVIAFAKLPEIKTSAWWTSPLNWSREFSMAHKDWLVPALAAALAIFSQIIKRRGQSRVDAVIKNLLNNFRDSAFPKQDDYVIHRVTLFQHRRYYWGWCCLGVLWNAFFTKHSRWRWPCSGWLVPYERAGEYHLESPTYFYAPKNDPLNAEGFAGLLLRSRLAKTITELPLISLNSQLNDKKRYSEAAFVSLEFVEKKLLAGRPLPRSFWGTYIDVDGKIWGVMVVDSRSDTLPKTLHRDFAPTAICLSQLLSRKSS